MILARRNWWAPAIACACGCACARSQPVIEESAADEPVEAVDPAELRVTSGSMTDSTAKFNDYTFRVEHPSFRAEAGEEPRGSAEIGFVYRGPAQKAAPLASGELRRQIGLKLRSRDTCNVVYVMWHIDPSQGIEVSVKANPGEKTHAECADRGYTFVKPAWSRGDLPAVQSGDQHTLRASITGHTLRVAADGRFAWEGPLPPQAFAFDGPVGVRSDNGIFDIAVRASAAAGEAVR